jgi:electron-transferring-flavoprotein dehydrogenase
MLRLFRSTSLGTGPSRPRRNPCTLSPLWQRRCSSEAEALRYDLLVVGAGPAGLSAAIRAKQCLPEARVAILEKGSEVGAHILSGNCFEPRALDELLPNWRQDPKFPAHEPVTHDQFALFLSHRRQLPLPVPHLMRNDANYIVSLCQVTRWLAKQAEALAVDIYPGFAGARLLVDKNPTRVYGVATNAFGIGRDGRPKPNYAPPVSIHATYTLLAEGCRGSLTRQAIERFRLADASEPQSYGLGVKELWRVPASVHQPGSVLHTVGWPLDMRTYGGSFMYHFRDRISGSMENLVAVGLVVGLDYKNPLLSPYGLLQKWKTHDQIRRVLAQGELLEYGARCLNEGGYQSIPQVAFPGGALIGCSAGFLNVPKLKGTHTAMKSGMLAAECCCEELRKPEPSPEPSQYAETLRRSWIIEELYAVRNIRPGFRWGLLPGLLHAAVDTYLWRGRAPYTWKLGRADHTATRLADRYRRPSYPAPDQRLVFDILTNLARSGTNHEHDQPCHLKLKDPTIPERVNLPLYGGPEQFYCPAKVYEYTPAPPDPASKTTTTTTIRLQINAQNCLHCKACDIKDPTQNIVWTPPEGGGGPRYSRM